MRLFSWNVNGVRAIAKKGFLEWLAETQPEILCLQETKAREEQLDASLLSEHGYHTYWHSAEKAGYSSVATFCKQPPLRVQKGLGIERFDREGRVLLTDHGEFLLYNIYFPNGQRGHERVGYKLDFYESLLLILNEQVQAGRHVIITGDWNTAHAEIDLARPRENQKTSGFLPEERALLDKYVEHGYVDTFRHLYPEARSRYSWWAYYGQARPNNVGWRIDYFFANAGFMHRVADAGIHEQVTGSDHCPVSLTLKPSP